MSGADDDVSAPIQVNPRNISNIPKEFKRNSRYSLFPVDQDLGSGLDRATHTKD